MLPASPWFGRGGNSAKVAHIASPVGLAVRIYNFTVITGCWGADMIIVTNHRSGVYDKNNDFPFARLSHPSHHTVFGIVKINPFESFVGIVQVPQRRLALI